MARLGMLIPCTSYVPLEAFSAQILSMPAQPMPQGECGCMSPGHSGHPAWCTPGPSCSPCCHVLHSSQIIPLHGVRGTSKPATETWDGRMGQLILIILYINNLQIICKFGNSCRRSNVTLLLLPHSSGCLSHSLVFPCLKLDCKWSGKGLGPPLPCTAPRSHSSNNNK